MIYIGQLVKPGDFIHRESMVRKVLSHLKRPGLTEIIGPALSGKTSLAHFITQSSEISKEKVEYLDLQCTQGDLKIAEALASNQESHKILIVDEVDVVCSQFESFVRWSRLLRALGRCNVSVISISHRSYNVYCHIHELRESIARARPLYMQTPHRAGCRQLAYNIFAESGITSPLDRDLDFIDRLAGCHPYLIEIAAQMTLEAYKDDETEVPNYQRLSAQFLLQCRRFFSDVIRFVYDETDEVVPTLAILYCAAMADASAISNSSTRAEDCERLENLLKKLPYHIGETPLLNTGIVSLNEGTIRPFSPILTWTFLRNINKERLKEHEKTLLYELKEKDLDSITNAAKQRLGLIDQIDTFFAAC